MTCDVRLPRGLECMSLHFILFLHCLGSLAGIFGNCCDSHVLMLGIKAFEPTLAHPVTQVDMGCGNGETQVR